MCLTHRAIQGARSAADLPSHSSSCRPLKEKCRVPRKRRQTQRGCVTPSHGGAHRTNSTPFQIPIGYA